jgi:PAS domain S-box-containing protein
LAIAALTLRGLHLWPAIAAGAFTANFLIAGNPVAVAAGIAVGNTLEALLGASVLRRMGVRGEISCIRDAAALLAVELLSPLPSVAAGVLSLSLGGLSDWDRFPWVSLAWWQGDSLGAFIVLPLVLSWCGQRLPAAYASRPVEFAAATTLIATLTSLAYLYGDAVKALGLPFLPRPLYLFPPLIWAALRLRPREAMLVMAVGSTVAVSFTVARTQGQDVGPLLFLVLVLFSVGGGWLLLFGAIAERTRVSQALRQNQAHLQTLIDHAPTGLAMFDRDMRYLALSRRWRDDYRIGDRDLIGVSHYEVFPELPAAWKEAHRRCLAGEVLSAEADHFERQDGSVQWVHWEIRPWRDVTDAVGGIVIFAEEITDRVAVVDALRRNREMLRLITDAVPALISYVDADFRYQLANLGYQRWFGLQPEEIVGQPVRQVLGEAVWNKVRPWMERALAGEAVSYDQELPYRQGGARWVTASYTPDRDEAGRVRGIVVLVVDINVRVAAEAALAASRQQFRGIVESAMDAIITIDAGQRIVLFNAAAEAMFRCAAGEALGATIERFIPARFRAAHADDIARFGMTGATSRTMGRLGEVYGLRCDGEEFPVEAAISQIEVAGERLYTVILRDISARVAAEEEIRRMNAELEARVEARTAELKAANQELDSFAYAVSHDLRAPLRAMSGFSHALIEDYGDRLDGEARVYLEQIHLAALHMGELIDGLLVLSRSTRAEMRRDPIDLSALSNRVASELVNAEPERQIEIQVQPGLVARGDLRMIEVVMRNLIGNAWKYTARTARPEIRVYAEEKDGHDFFCISDNGAGFDMAHADRLFQPFQRLHRQEEFTGTGIGLATVERIVHRHGGAVQAEGVPGQGATFCFSLPTAEKRGAKPS